MSAGLNELGISSSLNFFCPKCTSRNVIVKIEEKYVKLDRCNACGYVNNEELDY